MSVITKTHISSVAMKAKQIRKEFKIARIKASVTSRSGTLENAIDVLVFSGSVPVANQIAKKQYKVDRCERTGNILGGGNTFVTVKIDSSMVDAVCLLIASTVMKAAQDAMEGITQNSVKVEGTSYSLSWDKEDRRGYVWNKHRANVGRFDDPLRAPRAIAYDMLEEGFIVEEKKDVTTEKPPKEQL